MDCRVNLPDPHRPTPARGRPHTINLSGLQSQVGVWEKLPLHNSQANVLLEICTRRSLVLPTLVHLRPKSVTSRLNCQTFPKVGSSGNRSADEIIAS